MIQLPKSAALLLLLLGASLFALTACTPEYTRRQGEELAERVRLLDSVAIERNSQRVLTRQAQVCLVSADGGDEAGASLLRAMQAGFSGHFVAVGVAGESIDYLRAVSGTVCPGASYLFYVQPERQSACAGSNACMNLSQFIITVISAGDQTLIDRIRFSIKPSFLPVVTDERERQQKAFEQLAIALTGGK